MKPEVPWIIFNNDTHTYDTKDDTIVAAEVAEECYCLADVLRMSTIRAEQRLFNRIEKDAQ